MPEWMVTYIPFFTKLKDPNDRYETGPFQERNTAEHVVLELLKQGATDVKIKEANHDDS